MKIVNHTGECDLWDAGDLARLYALRAKGKSASEVAAEMGRSRNAVLGRLFRDRQVQARTNRRVLCRKLRGALGGRTRAAVETFSISAGLAP